MSTPTRPQPPSRRTPFLKLDEDSASHEVLTRLKDAAYEIDTAVDEGLAGVPDEAVLLAATGAGRVLITQDKGFGSPHRLVPHPCEGVIRLNLPGYGPSTWARRLLEVLPRLTTFRDTLHIVTADGVRSCALRGRRVSR